MKKIKLDDIHILPLSLILFAVPLVVWMSYQRLGTIEMAFWRFQEIHTDFYSYAKMLVFLALTGISIVLFSIYIRQGDRQISRESIYLPMIAYAFFIAVSTLGSAYTQIALRGFVDRYEGMFVLLSYLLVMFIAINSVDSEKKVKKLIYPLVVSAIIISVIGLFEYAGYNFFETEIGKRIILNIHYAEMTDRIGTRFGKGNIASTLYNPNYVGSYMAILIALTASYTLLLKEKNKKVLFGAISILLIATLLGSNSRGGFLGIMTSITLAMLLFRRVILKNIRLVLVFALLALGLGIGMDQASGGRVTNQISRLGSDMASIFKSVEESEEDKYIAKELTAQGNTLKFVTNRETLVFEYADASIELRDQDGSLLSYTTDTESGISTIDDDRYEDYQIGFLKDEYVFYIQMAVNDTSSWFTIENGEFRNYHGVGVVTDIEEVKTFGFEGKEMLGSGRGYIWSRSIPLLRNTILRGYGPDAYVIYFPQKDFVGNFNTGNIRITDKPHNLYLQIALNTGILSLLAFLWMLAIYIVKSWKLYYHSDFESFMSISGVGIFLGIVGYLVAGMFNDSVLGVAPVFWILLGTGLAINNYIEKDRQTASIDPEETLIESHKS